MGAANAAHGGRFRHGMEACGAGGRKMMRRRKRKRKLPLFGLVLLLVVVMGVTLLLTGWTVLGEEAGLEAVAVTGTAILPQES